MAVQTDEQRITSNDLDDRDSRQIRRDIEHTRHEMDVTLEEIGERLHPRRLLDYALDFVRSSSAETTADEAGKKISSTLKSVGQQLKQHPIPAAVIGAGLLWFATEQNDDEEEPRGVRGTRRRVEPGRPAWHSQYDWSQSQEDEQSWADRARKVLDDIKSSLADDKRPASEKLRSASQSIMSLSGMPRDQIRHAIHSRWADLDEHSGSFVDARTGKPYTSDQAYQQSGDQDWENLCGVGCLVESDEHHAQSWGDKATDIIDDIKQSLSQGGENARDAVRSIASKLGSFGNSIGESGSQWTQRATDGARAMWQRTSDGTHRLTGRAQEVGVRTQERVSRGYRTTRDRMSREIDEHPLAVGAAVLGVGLLAGLLLPRTKTEDELMGEAADDVRESAMKKGEQVMKQGEKVAQNTVKSVKEEVQSHATGSHEGKASQDSQAQGSRESSEQKAKFERQPKGAEDQSCST